MMYPAHNGWHEWMTFLHSRYTNNARVANPKSLRCGLGLGFCVFVFLPKSFARRGGPPPSDIAVLGVSQDTHTLQTSVFDSPRVAFRLQMTRFERHKKKKNTFMAAPVHRKNKKKKTLKLSYVLVSFSLSRPNQSNLLRHTQHMARIPFFKMTPIRSKCLCWLR